MQKPVDITHVALETPRLLLRPWQETDLADFYAYASVPGVGECAGWKHHESMEESARILAHFIAGRHTFAIVDKETGRAIGSLGLEQADQLADVKDEALWGCELGYVLSRDYWGKGLMPEAVRAALEYCLQSLQMDFVTCAHFMENDRSRRVIEKCGFSYVRDIGYETQTGEEKPSRLYVKRRTAEGDESAS